MSIAATRRIELRGAARRLLSCRDGEIVLSGPAGTGKSVGGLTKQHLAAMKYPGSTHLLLRKTAASLGASTLEVYRKHVAVASLAVGDVEYYGGSTSEPAQYRYKRNGSKIVIGGMDKPSKIMSSAYDTAVMDEGTEFFVADFEAVISRMRAGNMPYSQIILMCNPDAEHHWIYQRALSGGMTMLESRHEDNPAYYNGRGELTEAGAAYLAKLDRLTGVRYQRLRKGLWVAAEGLIYEDWDPAVHLVDRLPDGSEDWVRWWAVDFGYTNPTVIQCWAEDPDGRLWLYRELYRTGGLVEDHVRELLAIVRPDGEWIEPRPRGIVCDHDAEDRATFERHSGMRTLAAKKEVSPGIQAVQARLRKAGDGRPRVYVVRDALVRRDPELADAGKPTCFVEEITGYVWARGPDGKPAKEAPEKMNDHCLIAGTLVTTSGGDVPIERVGVGDLVLTRAGWRTVLASGMTGLAAEVSAVALTNGASLVGTGDHLVWVEDRGWVQLDSLRYGDRLLPWSRAFDSRALPSGAIPSPRIGRSAATSFPASLTARMDGSAFTRKSGGMRMAARSFPTAMRSTMSTSSRRTTIRPTSSAFLAPSTRISTGSAVASVAASVVGPLRRSRQLPRGTAAKRVGRGTPVMEPQAGTVPSTGRRPVSSVAQPSRPDTVRTPSASARTTARAHGAGRQALTMSTGRAAGAARRSASIAMRNRSAAVVSVLSDPVRLSERQPVFDLTVEGVPEFFASGVLVHNSMDTFRYVVAQADLGGRPGMRILGR